MSAAISALNTLAASGYSITIPYWVEVIGIIVFFVSLGFVALRLFKFFLQEESDGR